MALQITELFFHKFLDVLHESVLTFFLLCDNGRDMQSASIQEVLVQCNGTSYDLRRPRKTTLASRPKPPNLPAAGRPTARTTAHGLCNGGVGLLRLPASAPHARVRGCFEAAPQWKWKWDSSTMTVLDFKSSVGQSSLRFSRLWLLQAHTVPN